jgi:RHS repeat-associated protein
MGPAADRTADVCAGHVHGHQRLLRLRRPRLRSLPDRRLRPHTDTYDFDAFGNLLSSSGTTQNNYLFAGEQFDPALGIYYNRARYYDQRQGRFWTMDTYEGDPQSPESLHKYLYVSGDGVNRKDPSGNFDLVETQVATTIALGLDAANLFIGAATLGGYLHCLTNPGAECANSIAANAIFSLLFELRVITPGENDLLVGSFGKLVNGWVQVNETMSERAENYQAEISGRPGWAYYRNGVRFDGLRMELSWMQKIVIRNSLIGGRDCFTIGSRRKRPQASVATSSQPKENR